MKRVGWLTVVILAGMCPDASPQQKQGTDSFLECLASPSDVTGCYQVGDTACIRVRALAGGVPLENVTIYYDCGNDMYPADYEDSTVFHRGEALLPIGTRSEPGFRYCNFRFAAGGNSKHDFMKVAFSPDKICPTVKMPLDFQAYWSRELERTSKFPFRAEMTPVPCCSTSDVEVVLVKLTFTAEGRCLYGYLCKPRAEGHYPVLLNPPGAGMGRLKPDLSFAREGFITFTMEIHGISPLAAEEEYRLRWKEIGDYWCKGLDSREHYYYHDVFLGCVRAVDFLCSLPEFDGKHVGVYGGSQGGALTMATAALNRRVNFLVAFYPAMCDMSGFWHGKTGGWPKFFQKERIASGAAPEILNTLAYYDVANFARMLRVPGFYSWGYKDNTCPPTSVWAAVNCIRSPKTLRITPASAHWTFPAVRREALEWMKSQLK